MFWKSGRRLLRRTDVKLTAWYIVTFLASVLMISIILYLSLEHQLLKELDRFIQDETAELAEILKKETADRSLFQSFEEDAGARRYYPFFFQILDGQGNPLYRSKGPEGIQYPPFEGVIQNARKGKRTREEVPFAGQKRLLRVVSTPIFREGRLTHIVQFGTHLYFLRKSLGNFQNSLLAAFPIVLILSSLGGWILARRSLSPIGYIASKAQSLSSDNLGERLVSRGTGDEMDDLIRTVNEMLARLEASFKRMAEFTADASHELRTPLCALRGEAEVLLSRPRSAEEYQEALVRFIETFDRLNRMINDLILLSKGDTARTGIRMEPLRLDLILKDLGNLFQALAEQKGLAFETGASEEVIVAGDKVRLQQLFTNLIDNAIKYTETGFIRISVGRKHREAFVTVQDSGIGIPEEEQGKIFERFYRVDKSRSRETGGIGLGLSIVQWIVQAHGGRIEVESDGHRGSAFTVYLPSVDNASGASSILNQS